MRPIHASPALLALALAACQPIPAPAEPPAPVCPAPAYGGLVGTNAAAVTFPAGQDVRIIGPDTVVTMDYQPERLNLRVNRAGIIVSVDCG